MKNETTYIPNKDRSRKRMIQIVFFISIVYSLYFSFRFLLDSNYIISIGTKLGILSGIIWIILSEKKIIKIVFNYQDEKLLITERLIFGKEKSHLIKFSDLNYKTKICNNLLNLIIGRKRLVIKNKQSECFILQSIAEFNEKEIDDIVRSLDEIKNASS